MVARHIFLKGTVPCVAAGAILGKGGETIIQVQKEASFSFQHSLSISTFF
jgi:hypothetical protein